MNHVKFNKKHQLQLLGNFLPCFHPWLVTPFFLFFFKASPHISCDSYVEVMWSKQMTSLGIDFGVNANSEFATRSKNKSFWFSFVKSIDYCFYSKHAWKVTNLIKNEFLKSRWNGIIFQSIFKWGIPWSKLVKISDFYYIGKSWVMIS